ncbi:hypothetical protein Goshw_016433 [Gossypium schwendimanii]|uniref:Biogenesis of lysosome-related organelles complex 1 subunit 2 n=1 Tax=Gossypium schwendimanii TaxID=34291 RepID=A0A7J9N3M0_GOSSC|nr:hypothetical protein [Gossypium schwendimanii]
MADKEPEVQDDLAESLHDLFTSLSSMVKSELQGTNNVLELLEKMNLRVAQEYKGFGDVASGLRVFVEQLKNKSGNFDEYVQQIDAIEQQVTEFEAVISVLDRYVSLLESKVCSSDGLQRLLQHVVFVLCMLNLVVLLEADHNCFDDQRNSHHHENSSDIEAKTMGLNENDVVFSLECLVDVAVALASMEEMLKKETMRLKEGLKNIDNAIKLILVKVELRAMAIAWCNKENSCPWRFWKSFEELGQIRETARGCLLAGDF